MKKYFYLILVIVFYSCKSDAELSVERGIHYYDWGKYNEAILEFNKAKYLQITKSKQTYYDLQLLAQTHYNLAISYAKLDMFDLAHQEAQRAVSLVPNKEYREVLSLIIAKLQQINQ